MSSVGVIRSSSAIGFCVDGACRRARGQIARAPSSARRADGRRSTIRSADAVARGSPKRGADRGEREEGVRARQRQRDRRSAGRARAPRPRSSAPSGQVRAARAAPGSRRRAAAPTSVRRIRYDVERRTDRSCAATSSSSSRADHVVERLQAARARAPRRDAGGRARSGRSVSASSSIGRRLEPLERLRAPSSICRPSRRRERRRASSARATAGVVPGEPRGRSSRPARLADDHAVAARRSTRRPRRARARRGSRGCARRSAVRPGRCAAASPRSGYGNPGVFTCPSVGWSYSTNVPLWRDLLVVDEVGVVVDRAGPDAGG